MSEHQESGRPVVSIEYAGRWIAWDSRKTRIVATGNTVQEVQSAATAAGEEQPILAKVPAANARLIGPIQ
jgi:hypothetical protein